MRFTLHGPPQGGGARSPTPLLWTPFPPPRPKVDVRVFVPFGERGWRPHPYVTRPFGRMGEGPIAYHEGGASCPAYGGRAPRCSSRRVIRCSLPPPLASRFPAQAPRGRRGGDPPLQARAVGQRGREPACGGAPRVVLPQGASCTRGTGRRPILCACGLCPARPSSLPGAPPHALHPSRAPRRCTSSRALGLRHLFALSTGAPLAPMPLF